LRYIARLRFATPPLPTHLALILLRFPDFVLSYSLLQYHTLLNPLQSIHQSFQYIKSPNQHHPNSVHLHFSRNSLESDRILTEHASRMSRDATAIDDLDYDHIAIALDKYEQRADEIRRMLSHLYTIHENYSSLYKRLLTFDKKIKHQTFIPFGSHAFIPGQIVNTNMLTVFLGEGYYREMSTPDTVLLIQKRITGLQNEIATYQREMQSFGHHIQNLHSILGKPLHTPSLSDKMAEKLTGQASSLNTEEVEIAQFQTSQQIPKPVYNPRDPTASLQPTRATRTTQGKNEDGDDIVDIVEYFEADVDADVKPTNVRQFNHTQHEPQLFKAFPDMPDFQPHNYTTNADGELVLRDEHKAQIKDVFYESLDRTLSMSHQPPPLPPPPLRVSKPTIRQRMRKRNKCSLTTKQTFNSLAANRPQTF